MTQPSPVPDRPAPQSPDPTSPNRSAPPSSPGSPGAVTPHDAAGLPAPGASATPPPDLGAAGNPPSPPVPDPASTPRHLGTPVPFAAPPRDRDNTRLAVTIVVSVVAVVLLCGGGFFGLGAALVATGNELYKQSRDAAAVFMTDVADGALPAAYDSLCEPVKREVTLDEFEREWDPLEINAFQLDNPRDTGDGSFLVSVRATSATSAPMDISLTVSMSGSTMKMEVCGWEAE